MGSREYRLEAQVLLAAAALWGLYGLLYSCHAAVWLLDLPFLVLALLLWLGRSRPILLLSSLGILLAVAARNAFGFRVAAALDILYIGTLLFGGARRTAARLTASAASQDAKPGRRAVLAGIAVAMLAFLAVYAARPIHLMVDPEKRHQVLRALAPSFPVKDPAELSPLAARLRAHVMALAGVIGERSAYQPLAQLQAMEYLASKLREAGYSPEVLEFSPERKEDFERKRPYANVEAVLEPPRAASGVWIVGAHYDSAAGTLGADDNASAVAVLLEAARLLKGKEPRRGVRFVAFDTEEPPAFGTRDMGSARYERSLSERGVRVHAMVSLEMLGYFNTKPGSQLQPPFLGLLYPDTGDFVYAGSDLASVGLLRSFLKAWRRASGMPIEGVSLPAPFCILAMSDQLNFWFAGRRALMLSDGAFFRNPDYHQMTDSPEKLDYERMAMVTEALAAVLTQE